MAPAAPPAVPTEPELEPRVRSRRAPGERPAWLGGLVGVVVIVVVWAVLGVAKVAGGTVPTPWAVVASLSADGWSFYGPSVGATVRGAAFGFLWGNGLALLLAVLVLLVPPLEKVMTQVAVVSYCLPLTAIGPVLLVVFNGGATRVFLAAISVFFTTLVGALLGLRSADRASLDVVTAYGGGRFQQLMKVRVVAALPSTLAGLKIAAPASLLGAIIGEYLGGVDQGLGIILTTAQTQLLVPRVWAIALVCGALAGIGYLLVAVIARFVTPWSSGSAPEGR